MVPLRVGCGGCGGRVGCWWGRRVGMETVADQGGCRGQPIYAHRVRRPPLASPAAAATIAVRGHTPAWRQGRGRELPQHVHARGLRRLPSLGGDAHGGVGGDLGDRSTRSEPHERTETRHGHEALGHQYNTHDVAAPAWRPTKEASVRAMVRRSRAVSGVVRAELEAARRGERPSVAASRVGTPGGCLCSEQGGYSLAPLCVEVCGNASANHHGGVRRAGPRHRPTRAPQGVRTAIPQFTGSPADV